MIKMALIILIIQTDSLSEDFFPLSDFGLSPSPGS